MIKTISFLAGFVVLAMAGSAKADCDYEAPATRSAEAYEAALRVVERECVAAGEVIELADGSFRAQCDEQAWPDELAACSVFAEGLGLGKAEREDVQEACMVIAIHTGAVFLADDKVVWVENGVTHSGSRYEFEESGPTAIPLRGY